MKYLLSTIAALGLAVSPAFADGAKATGVSISKKADDCSAARTRGKTCFLDMEEEEVDGGVPTAAGEKVDAETLARGRSLIKLRLHFLDKILKSPDLL